MLYDVYVSASDIYSMSEVINAMLVLFKTTGSLKEWWLMHVWFRANTAVEENLFYTQKLKQRLVHLTGL